MARDAQATQAKLLQAARSYFAAHGFERSTVRAIAAEAGVNVALISRYFGSKEELFAQAVAIDLALPDLAGTPHKEIGPRLVEHFFRRWEGKPADDLLQVLIRTAATHPAAAAKIRTILAQQIEPAVMAFTQSEHAGPRAALIATQILGLAYCRYVLELSERDLPRALAVRAIGETLGRYLTLDLTRDAMPPGIGQAAAL